MRIAGLEPVYLAAPEPKSGVSASSTISATDQIVCTVSDDGGIIYYFCAECNWGQAPVSAVSQSRIILWYRSRNRRARSASALFRNITRHKNRKHREISGKYSENARNINRRAERWLFAGPAQARRKPAKAV